MDTKKVVIDTNTIISGFGWKGKPHQILQMAISKEIDWIISTHQLDEITRVITYPHLKFTTEQQEELLEIIRLGATIITISGKLNIMQEDPNDNHILEAAIESQADYLITGDDDLLRFKHPFNVKIVTSTAFLLLKEN